MTTEMKPVKDEFGDPIEQVEPEEVHVHKTEIKRTNDSIEVGFKFPKDVDPSIIREAMDVVGKITADRMKAKSLTEQSREVYRKTGHKRYRCTVESLRKGIKYFDLIIPHPETDRPIKVMGSCGVILEDGITRYTINSLQNSYTMRTEEIPLEDQNLRASLAITYTSTRVPNFRVTIHGEIENPKPVGSIGRSLSPQAIG